MPEVLMNLDHICPFCHRSLIFLTFPDDRLGVWVCPNGCSPKTHIDKDGVLQPGLINEINTIGAQHLLD